MCQNQLKIQEICKAVLGLDLQRKKKYQICSTGTSWESKSYFKTLTNHKSLLYQRCKIIIRIELKLKSLTIDENVKITFRVFRSKWLTERFLLWQSTKAEDLRSQEIWKEAKPSFPENKNKQISSNCDFQFEISKT